MAVVEWSPLGFPHVRGRHEQRVIDPASGESDGQRYWCECTVCGATWQGLCMSGRVRARIRQFAAQHAHRDPFEPR